MQPVQPRPRLQYKQPNRLNGVSLTIALFLALIGYVAHALWPAFSLRSNVESELADALPGLWKLNHHSDGAVRAQVHKLKQIVTQRLRQVGVTDKGLQVVIHRDRKTVAMEARYKASFTFPVLEKTITLTFNPRVQTDAARVEW